jgi:hypothetical protein
MQEQTASLRQAALRDAAAVEQALTFEQWWDEWCERQRGTLTEYDFKVAEAAWIASRAAVKR